MCFRTFCMIKDSLNGYCAPPLLVCAGYIKSMMYPTHKLGSRAVLQHQPLAVHNHVNRPEVDCLTAALPTQCFTLSCWFQVTIFCASCTQGSLRAWQSPTAYPGFRLS